ncbi:galactokinase [Clostridium sp. 19966]|uniref:galactokinase n=1 Tax=Clostridium sp. 19966 TaxID=2768166 RepID=UPI0028DF3099|nr:galactokinase [Clostridium sp. 19966]MDT8715639.1 galactokinase [Clostridium sp. 19966]
MELKELKEKFVELYGEGQVRSFHSPGRVNLIGEHIDYNGGYVFPCALEFGTYACVRKREDNKVNLASTNFDLQVSVDVENIVFKEEDDWANYPKGVIKIMKEMGYKVGGMDIVISGNIPNGAGLSSSASLELLIGVIVNNLFNAGKIEQVDLVKIGQKAENVFVGVNCGIMDQFAVGMGKKGKAILLNCDTLDYEYANVDLKDYCLVIMNTNKRRALNESKYNERRAECDEALAKLNEVKPVKELCNLSSKEFEEIAGVLDKENVRNRAAHAIYENERVKEAFKCLNEGKLEEFGKLLTASHNSLRDLYEVTGKELDTIVEEALKAEGCIGARMTGAGFGGCAIAVVKKNKTEEFKSSVGENYKSKIGYRPSFYMSGIGNGSVEI